MIDLSGKHIFIAGGSRGIGASAAIMAAGAGASISLTYQSNRAAADQVVSDIEKLGGKSLALQSEISDADSVGQAVDESVRQFGSLDGLVVSAGVFEGCAIEEMTSEFWDRTMAINVRGTFLAVQAAAKHMRGKGGSIVIYTSTAGQRGSAVYSAYAASKAAQIMFMRSMALELAPNRIRVNCVAPAWTETDMAAPSLDKLGRESVAGNVPLGRIGQPNDVAGATCYLLSDLSEFISGSTITVDGGADMRG